MRPLAAPLSEQSRRTWSLYYHSLKGLNRGDMRAMSTGIVEATSARNIFFRCGKMCFVRLLSCRAIVGVVNREGRVRKRSHGHDGARAAPAPGSKIALFNRAPLLVRSPNGDEAYHPRWRRRSAVRATHAEEEIGRAIRTLACVTTAHDERAW